MTGALHIEVVNHLHGLAAAAVCLLAGGKHVAAGAITPVVALRIGAGISIATGMAPCNCLVGLAFCPRGGRVWALQNQDGNSTLTLIDPEGGTVSNPIPCAVPSASRGYDDVVFRLDGVFLSSTNPVSGTDPTTVLVQQDSNPIVWQPTLQMGALGNQSDDPTDWSSDLSERS